MCKALGHMESKKIWQDRLNTIEERRKIEYRDGEPVVVMPHIDWVTLLSFAQDKLANV